MMPIGTTAPDFELTDVVSGLPVTMRGYPSVATVVVFICNHCPSVLHFIREFVSIANEMQKRGVRVIAISSNDPITYPADAPDCMATFAMEHGFTFPYVFDESQETAKAYQAACTPDLYLFDAELLCVYRGRFDASTPGNGIPLTGEDLREAVESVLNGQPVSSEQYPAIGCSIKWRVSP